MKQIDFDNAFSNELSKINRPTIDNANTTSQMARAISESDWSDARLLRLKDAIDNELNHRAAQHEKQAQLQQFKLAIIQLAKEYGTSFSDIVSHLKAS